jgi:hypothetical protein
MYKEKQFAGQASKDKKKKNGRICKICDRKMILLIKHRELGKTIEEQDQLITTDQSLVKGYNGALKVMKEEI